MRRSPTKHIERYRVRSGRMASDESFGANGAFVIPYNGVKLSVISSDGSDWQDAGLPGDPWEHVSVSVEMRCPTWEEMDFVKRIFWRDDETVLQFHVQRDKHVNFHNTCLHMWKPIGVEVQLPPSLTVGPRKSQVVDGLVVVDDPGYSKTAAETASWLLQSLKDRGIASDPEKG